MANQAQQQQAAVAKDRAELQKLLDVSTYVKNMSAIANALIQMIGDMMNKHVALLQKYNEISQLEAVDKATAHQYSKDSKMILGEVVKAMKAPELKKYKLMLKKSRLFYKLTKTLMKHIMHDSKATMHQITKTLIKKRVVNRKIQKMNKGINNLNRINI